MPMSSVASTIEHVSTKRLVAPVLAAGALAGLAAGLRQPIWVVAALAAAASIGLWRRLPLAIHALTLWVPIQYAVTKDLALLPRAAVWLDEATLVGLAAALVLRRVRLSTPFGPTPIDRPLLAFLLVAAASAIANEVRPIVAILGLRDLLQYLVVFYALAWLPLSPRLDRACIRLAVGVGLLQAPVALVQAALLFRGAGDRLLEGNYDMTVGTFGPSGGDFVAYYVTFLFLLLLARARYGRPVNALVFPALIIPFVASTSRLCFLAFPPCALWLFRRQVLSHPRRLVVPTAVIGIALAGLALYYRNDPALMRMVFDPRTIVASQFTVDAHYVGRAVHYPMAWTMLTDMAASPWLGLGPGMYVGPTAHHFMVPATRLVYDVFGMDPATLRFGSVDSGILPIVTPYGVLGLTAFAWILARVFGMARALERSARRPEDRALGAGMGAIVLFAVLGCLAAPVFEVQVLAYFFWLFAGLAVRAARRNALSGRARGHADPLAAHPVDPAARA